MKRVWKIAAGVVLALVLLIVVALSYINRLAKVAIETAATRALGVSTTLDQVELGIFSGTSSMAGFTVANPSNFKSSHFLQLNQGTIDLSVSALRHDVVEIPRVELSGIRINLVKENGQTNFRTIVENVKRFESSDGVPAGEKDRKRFIIRELIINDINVHLDLLPAGGQLTQLDVPIEQLRLENVGSEGVDGATLASVTITVVKSLLNAIAVKGENVVPEDVLVELAERLAELRPIEALRARLQDLDLKDLRLRERVFPEGVGGRLRNLRERREIRRQPVE